MRLAKRLATACLCCLVVSRSVWLAADEIDRHSSKTPLRGTIISENSKEVAIKVTQGGKTEDVTIGLGDVIDIRYDGAAGLAIRTAAGLERAGQLEKAITAYEKVAGTAGNSGLVNQAATFGKTRSLAKLAIQDPKRLEDGIKSLEEFRTKNADSRFHFALHELLGQLQLAKGNDAAAAQAFRELAAGPTNELKMRAAIWDGRLLMKAGKLTEAQTKFDEVVSGKAVTATEKLRQQEALLAKGDCLVRSKKLDEAEQLFRKVIDETSPDEAELQAATRVALGDVLRDAGKAKEALMAYLQVDLLYSTEKAEHAKAVYHIAAIWAQLGRADFASEAGEKLSRLYPESSWAKQQVKP